MPSTATLRALGLNTSPNSLNIPDGSLITASNVIIKRDNIVESRRGFVLYGDAMGSSSDRAKQLMSYDDILLRHYDDFIQFQDGFNNDGSVHFATFAGNYLETQAGLRIKSQESNNNFYFTTSNGIAKISINNVNQLTISPGVITQAGGINAVGLSLALSMPQGTTNGFLPENSAVAYRVVWGYTDANNNLILGAPSQNVAIYNPLEPAITVDFLTILQALDNINQAGSLINFGNYLQTFALPATASAVQIYDALLALSAQLDQNIVIVPNLALTSQVLTSQRLTTTTAQLLINQDITGLVSVGEILSFSGFLNTDFNTRKYTITGETNTILVAPNAALYTDVTFSQRITTTTSQITFNTDVSALLRSGSIITPSNFTNTDFNTRTYTVNTVNTNTTTLAPVGSTTVVGSQRLTTNTAIVLVSTDITGQISDGDTLNFLNFSNTDFNTRSYFITDSVNTITIIPAGNTTGNATISTSQRLTATTSQVVFTADITGLLTVNDVVTFANFVNTDFNSRTYTVTNIISGTTVQLTVFSGGSQTGTDTNPIAESIYATATIPGTTLYLTLTSGSAAQTNTDAALVPESVNSTINLTNTVLDVTVLTGGPQTGTDGSPVAETASSQINTTGTTLDLTLIATPTTPGGTDNTPQTGTDSAPVEETTAAVINRYYYQAITPALVLPDEPATGAELVALQTYLASILLQLQSEPNGIIPANLISQYLNPIQLTTSANVTLTIGIPQGVTSNYFFQVYRSAIFQGIGTTVLAELVPDDELQQVYEAFPTAAQLAAGVIVYTDVTPDAFRGANLYTNPSTGQGILQANDIPPLAKDLTKFKNVMFYANTQTRQQLSLNLLGVTNMIEDFENGIPSLPAGSPNLKTAANYVSLASSTINNTGTSVITGNIGLYPGLSITGFPPGIITGTEDLTNAAAKQAEIDALAAYTDASTRSSTIIPSALDGQTLAPGVYSFTSGAATLATSAPGTLTLDAGGNPEAIWIIQTASTLTTGAGGAAIINVINGGSPGNVYWTIGSSASLNITSTGSIFQGNVLAQSYITIGGGTVNGRLLSLTGAVTIISAARINPVSIGITPTITIASGNSYTEYTFVTGLTEIDQITTNAASTLIQTASPASYFLLNSANNTDLYYVWYQDGPLPSDPMIAGRIGIRVVINTTDTAVEVANKTMNAITVYALDFNVILVSGSTIQISATAPGYTNPPVDGSGGQATGFTFLNVISGRGQLLQNKISDITCVADVANSLNGTYFNVQTTFDQNLYYFWFKTSGGPVLNPLPPGRIGVEVNITTGDSATNVATAVALAFNSLTGIFSASSIGAVVTVTDEAFGTSTNFSDGTIPTGFTFSVVQAGAAQVLLSTNVSPAIAVEETANSLVNIINQNPNEINYAYYISSPEGVPGEISLENIGFSNDAFYVIGNNAITGASFNPNIAPEYTISNISVGNPTTITAIGHNFSNGDQILIADTNSLPTINGIYTISNVVAGVSFTIPVQVIVAGNTGVVSALSQLTAFSQNEVMPNRIYYSKLQQPESVPDVNYIDVGEETKAILRIIPIRDSLFILKEDGLYRISGEVAPFTLSLFDSSYICVAADSASISNNLIYSWTTQGISSISESGTVPSISRPIDISILPLATPNYPNFNTATWGVGYESDNSYLVFTVSDTTDIEATICYRYSTLTNSWTTYDKTDTCGIVNPADDRLYLGAGDTNYLEQERKTFTRLDYADRELDTTLSANNYLNTGLTLALDSVTGYAVGDVVYQEQTVSIFNFNSLLEKLDLDPGVAAVNITNITTGTLITITTAIPHSLINGNYVTITGSNSLPSINGSYIVSGVTSNTFQITVTTPVTTVGTSGIARYSYVNNLQVAGGVDLRIALSNLAARLDIDPRTVNRNYAALIGDLTGSLTNAAGDPTLVTSVANGLITGRVITISGSNSLPSINGNYIVTVVDTNDFTIPVAVLTPGTTGSFTTVIDDFNDLLASYNAIIGNLNSDGGVSFHNYVPITQTTIQEAIIQSINIPVNQITLNNSLPWVQGPLTIFKAIPTLFQYTPLTMQDPLMLKQFREATMMFEDKTFTRATVSFSTDLLPGFIDVPFGADGNGIFGFNSFGTGFFGGVGNAAPLRTYIPRQAQRCRFLNIQFAHQTAREKWSCFGVTVTGEMSSTRAYR